MQILFVLYDSGVINSSVVAAHLGCASASDHWLSWILRRLAMIIRDWEVNVCYEIKKKRKKKKKKEAFGCSFVALTLFVEDK